MAPAEAHDLRGYLRGQTADSTDAQHSLSRIGITPSVNNLSLGVLLAEWAVKFGILVRTSMLVN